MSNYDAWLEAPYQRMYAEGDAYADFCDEHDLEYGSDEAEAAWEDYREAMSEPDPDAAYDQWREDRDLDLDYD